MPKLFKKYSCVKQYDITECGAACLATVFGHYGLKMSIAQVREIAGTDRAGTNAYGLVKAAEKMGFTARGIKAGEEELRQMHGFPVIAHLLINQRLLHYVVIHAVKKNMVIVADPSRGIVKYSWTVFRKIWTGGLILLTPNASFKPATLYRNMLWRFYRLLLPLKKILLVIFLVSLLYTLFGIMGSFYIKYLFDDVMTGKLAGSLHLITLGFVAVFLFHLVLGFWRNTLLTRLGLKIDRNLMVEYYQHVLQLPMNFFSSRKVGEIISRFMEASRIREAVSGVTITIMVDSLMAIAGGIILYRQNTALFLITLVIIAVYAVIVISFGKPLRTVNHSQMEDNSVLTAFMVESLEGIETVKAYNAELRTGKKTEKRFDALIGSMKQSSRLNILLFSFTTGVSGLGTIAILWAGTYQVLAGHISSGGLLMFNALLVFFLNPVKNLIDLQATVQTAAAAATRLGEILGLQKEQESRTAPVACADGECTGKIEFSHVTFRYGTRKPVLKDINLGITPGQKIALIGESGSGKTSLIKLLLNFYTPESGVISIGGRDIRQIPLPLLRSRIAVVSQETFLFSGTVRENICLGTETAEIAAVEAAARLADAHDFINELPLQYETCIEENGANLSGGQRQRIALARALLQKPAVLILDEATSHLDLVSAKAVERTIRNWGKAVTIIVITHRLNTVVGCDCIYLLDKGEIVEAGTHTALMAQNGLYGKIWQD